MKKTTYQYYCDVCGKEVEEKNIERGFSLPVYFLNTKKFINKEIDLCFKCLNKKIKSNFVSLWNRCSNDEDYRGVKRVDSSTC